MNEMEFSRACEALFARVEDAVDALGLDFESMRSGNVLTLESDGGEQIVINQHAPTMQVWLASGRLGGLHFTLRDGLWLSTRTGETFASARGKALGAACGEPVSLEL